VTDFEKILSGGDLRSIGKSNSVILKIQIQKYFDEFFKYLFHEDRLVVMRAADTIEKITINNPQYLTNHKSEIFELCNVANDKELKWHLALLIPRLHLDNSEFGKAWNTLTKWAKDKTNSRIVRVNSIQGLFEMMKQKSELEKDFSLTLAELEKESVPSINDRIRKLENISR
jgi:hypothetical protein